MAPALSKPCRKPTTSASITALQFDVRGVINALLSGLADSLSSCQMAVTGFVSFLDSAFQCCLESLPCRSWCPADLFEWLTAEGPPLLRGLPVLFVLQILVMLYNAFVFAYMPAAGLTMFSPTSLVFHALVFMILTSLAKAVNTDPGTVPEGNKWRCRSSPPAEATERKRDSDSARWCKHTGVYKPDRAHHCRSVGRVVLRMDHHCPWIGNTVGFANHKFFFLFLLYTNAACGVLNIGLIDLLMHATLPSLSTFLLIGSASLSMLLSSILGPFFLFHCHLLSRNMTTVEFAEQSENQEQAMNPDSATTSPYDMGLWSNISSVLGENPLLWFVPVGGPAGDGVTFLRSADSLTTTDSLLPRSSHTTCSLIDLEAQESNDDDDDDNVGEEWDDCGARSENEEDGQMVTQGIASIAWRTASEVTDDFWVGCSFLGEALLDSCKPLEDAGEHSLLEIAQCGVQEVGVKFEDALCRFGSICSASSGAKPAKKRSSRIVIRRQQTPTVSSSTPAKEFGSAAGKVTKPSLLSECDDVSTAASSGD